MKSSLLYIALIGSIALGFSYQPVASLIKKAGVNPTPLENFEAPFVFGNFNVPADNPLTEEGVELGRFLFYDKRLSATGTISCASCHQQSHAFADSRGISVGVSNIPLEFNSMSLANLLWGPQHFFWDGRSPSLENQVLEPIINKDEMGHNLGTLVTELKQIEFYRDKFAAAYGDIDKDSIAKALASFIRTLMSYNSKYDQYIRGEAALTNEEELGRKLFMAHPDVKTKLRGANCIDCHSQFLTSGFSSDFEGFSNNGLDTESTLKNGLSAVTGNPAHKGMFKTPTLRNIALTAPYMHDGRFKTLEEVVEHYNSGIKNSSTLSPLISEAANSENYGENTLSLGLSAHEKKALIAFLHTLTDDSFLVNEDFSDPFSN